MTEQGQLQTFSFMHRENTIAKREAGMNRWDYRGIRWQAERPADGERPLEVEIECPVCARVVDVSVHSEADKRRHRATMAGLSIAGLVILVAGLVLAWCGISTGEDFDNADPERETYDALGIIGVVGVMVGLTVAWAFYLKREAQIGVKGGGAGAAGYAKHIIGEVNEPVPGSAGGAPSA